MMFKKLLDLVKALSDKSKQKRVCTCGTEFKIEQIKLLHHHARQRDACVKPRSGYQMLHISHHIGPHARQGKPSDDLHGRHMLISNRDPMQSPKTEVFELCGGQMVDDYLFEQWSKVKKASTCASISISIPINCYDIANKPLFAKVKVLINGKGVREQAYDVFTQLCATKQPGYKGPYVLDLTPIVNTLEERNIHVH